MKHILPYCLFIVIMALTGCHSNNNLANLEAVDGMEGSPVPSSAPPKPSQTAVKDTTRKLIKKGFVEFETSNLSSTREKVLQAANQNNSYISSDRESMEYGRKRNTLTIRVPASRFNQLLASATDGVEHFDSKEITVEDVTEEFLDVEARVKTKKELEARYLALLDQTHDIPEILEIEKQLEQLRGDIESIEGRLKYLQNRVAYSTLNISFYEALPTPNAPKHNFSNAFKNGWDNFISFLLLLVNIWPLLLVAGGIFIGISAYRKRKKNQQ